MDTDSTLLTPQVRESVRRRLLEELSSAACGGRQDLEGRVEAALLSEGCLWPRRLVTGLAADLAHELFGLGPLEPLMEDDTVTEVMINGPDNVYVERSGRLERSGARFGCDARVVEVVRRIIGPLNLRLDETSPMVDARLPDGSRLNAVIPPLSVNGPVVTIRRFRPEPFTLDDLVDCGTVTTEAAAFLREAVRTRANMIISGGTSSGKTTLLNALAALIPDGERLITIEDAAELRVRHPHVVTLESRPAGVEGRGEVTVRQLVRNALRMRPDRIIIGEVRGGETLDMLQAMNTGHPGSITTAHANSPSDLLTRLETMVLLNGIGLDGAAVRRQVGSAIDLILHTERAGGGLRVLAGIVSIACSGSGEYDLEHLFPPPGNAPPGRERSRPAREVRAG